MAGSQKLARSGQSLWTKAKTLIPGGNMLLSKRAEMYLPNQWPAYFSKARGCQVWDLDGNKFLDVSLMSVGTNLLGYGHPKVDRAVREVVRDGVMSTFNAPEEVYLAEQLTNLHPWSEMARFARSGGEANAIAVRIARAFSGKEGVAVCGYHGWHDWYMAANLGQERELDGHLLPGLNPSGVPETLTGTTFTFNYNDANRLLELVQTHRIGVIKMEVQRGISPAPGFLEQVRAIADQYDAVLIFDECTSGFRETFGGLHLKYGVEPDMAVFGKALGNGYAISAVVGRKEVMQAAQETFISSTFWTERIGPAAALATLEVMNEVQAWRKVSEIGRQVKKAWVSIASENNVPISVSGLDALASFVFQDSENHQAYRTFITQEMLAKGFLATNTLYASLAHTPQVISRYLEALNEVVRRIAELGPEGVGRSLTGPVAHSGFARLN